MPHRATKMIRWNVRCKDNGHNGVTYVLAGDTYGRLLGGTPHNELVEFNTWEDPVVDEVSGLVHKLLGREQGTSDCFGQVLGFACDPAPSGERYDFTGKIWCPVCGSPNVTYGPVNPPQFEVIDLSFVTHNAWQQLNEQGKTKLIKDALRAAGCLS